MTYYSRNADVRHSPTNMLKSIGHAPSIFINVMIIYVYSLNLLLWPMLPRLIEPYLWYLWLILHLKFVLIVIKVSIYLPSSQKTVDAEFHNAYFVRSNVSSQCNSCKKPSLIQRLALPLCADLMSYLTLRSTICLRGWEPDTPTTWINLTEIWRVRNKNHFLIFLLSPHG